MLHPLALKIGAVTISHVYHTVYVGTYMIAPAKMISCVLPENSVDIKIQIQVKNLYSFDDMP